MLFSAHYPTATSLLWGLYRGNCISIVAGDVSRTSDLQYFPLCRRFYPIAASSIQALDPDVIERLRVIVRSNPVDILMPGCFDTVQYLSYYAKEIDFVPVIPLPSFSTIRNLHDKYKFHLFCRTHGIRTPETMLLREGSSLCEANLPLSFPVLVKPLELSGGAGIYRFDDFQSLNAHLDQGHRERSDEFPLLLQEYIPGADIDFNGFALDGRLCAWTIQRWMQVEGTNGEFFSWLQFVQDPEIFEIGARIAKATSYSGPFHVDLRIDERNGNILALETNPRFWGSVLASMNEGVNFAEVSVRTAFDPDYRQEPRLSCSIWGNPVQALLLAFKKKGPESRYIASRHSWFQMNHMLMERSGRLISMGRKKLERFVRITKKVTLQLE